MIAKYSDKLASEWQSAFIVYKGDEPIAYMQSYRANEAGPGWWPGEPETTVGIDQFIGNPLFLGRGIGTEMVREFSDWLLSIRDIKKVITDPDPRNERAVRCYRKAGFIGVGLRGTPEGQVLLMRKEASLK